MQISKVLSVDLNDRPLCEMTKQEAHGSPALHRAFSIFVHDGCGNMLIQRRAMCKYHSGGLWSNACCSHPLESGAIEEQARERMQYELGVQCEVRELFTYTYFHRFSPELAEYEYDHVLLGKMDSGALPSPQPDEVMEWKWISFDALEKDVRSNPDAYSVWFIGTVGRVIEEVRRNG